MAVMRWDEQSQAFVETTNVPMRYDETSQAWVETTGMAWDSESQAWTERWGQKVTAYVYGAALETVTIKKDGIIVATVSTDSSGQSTEQIALGYGTYTLTGSVSGWTEEQTVDKDTMKFRAMPEGALYWYGNECTDVTGGWNEYKRHALYASTAGCAVSKNTNSLYCKSYINNTETDKNWADYGYVTTNEIDRLAYTMAKIKVTTDGASGVGTHGASLIYHQYFYNICGPSSTSVCVVDVSDASTAKTFTIFCCDTNAHKYGGSFEAYALWLE